MIQNKDYWITRYSKMKGYNVVGHRSWSYEQYIEETNKFFDKISPYLPSQKREGTLALDFGCGIGRCIPLLKSRYSEYWGVDIIEPVIYNNQRQYPDCKFAVIRKDGVIPINRKFDLIFSNVVLQHVVDDGLLRFYIQQFHSLIKNNGYVLLVENVDTKHQKHPDVEKYIKFRSINEYKALFKPYFKLEVVNTFISSKEEHAIMKGTPNL